MSGQPLAVIKPVRKEAVPERLPMNKTKLTQVVNEFQLDTVEIDTRPEPFQARATLWVLGALVVFAISWAVIANVDRVVTARGKIVSIAPNVIVQPLEAAIVRSIDVKVGDMVKAGSVLATMDPTFAEADVEQIEAKIASLDAAVARLEAERQSRTYAPDRTSRFEYGGLQQAIWSERMTQLKAQMRLFEERIARARANITAREQERNYLTQRLKVLNEVESMRLELEKSQTGSRLNSLIARDSRIEVERNLAIAESAIQQNRHELEAVQAERDVFSREWDRKVIEELVTKRNERDGLIEQLVKARRRQDMIRLATPVDAVVLEIAQRSVGSIIKDAEPFIKLVPLDSPLEIEGMIDAKQIGYVAVGDSVQVKLDAYSYQEHGMAEGVVKVISSDTFTDNQRTPDAPTGPYYKARIELISTGLRNVPDNFHLIPGMPLNAEIKVGKRSVMSYFLRPILRGLNESMREP